VHRVGRTGRGLNKGDALSFCSKGEQELLEEIQQFITKDIEVIKVTRQDHTFTVAPPKEPETIQGLIDEYENWTKKKKKSTRKGAKKAKKRK